MGHCQAYSICLLLFLCGYCKTITNLGKDGPLIIFYSTFFVLFFQFFMSIAALVVMIVHVFTKPYKKEYINIIEAAILLDLLLVTGAFLDPSSEQVPDWFAYILVFLPYIFCIGYICWLIGKRIK